MLLRIVPRGKDQVKRMVETPLLVSISEWNKLAPRKPYQLGKKPQGREI
jgi:hypothetical protein